MVLLYSHTPSSRFSYISNFIFKELLGLDYTFTTDPEAFKNHDGVSINYSDTIIKEKEFRISNYNLLFEISIKEQPVTCFETNGYKAFFKIDNCDFAFDIFAATFYLLSRYEEYLPHTKDMYGRYAHENALAFKEGFLQLPLVNTWVKAFALEIKKKYSMFNVQCSMFRFEPTYDIDIAYSYKYKGLLRNIGGFLKSPSLERIKVLLGLQKDPFDAYNWLHQMHQQNKLQPVYFFLMAEKKGIYDKNISPDKSAMWQLIKRHSRNYTVGIHPSWQSGDVPPLLKKEKEYLAEVIEKKVTASRQHYIRFDLPEGYQKLIDAGITDDYSMGYGSINGFRASVASSFFWYDLQNEKQTSLRIHPFCFMEANSYYEQQFFAAQAYEELLHYYHVCKEASGTLITIWHNNFLGTVKEVVSWKKMYEEFVGFVSGES